MPSLSATLGDRVHPLLGEVTACYAKSRVDSFNNSHTHSMWPRKQLHPDTARLVARHEHRKASRGRCVVCEQRHRSHSLRGLLCSLRGWQLTLSNARLELDGPTDNGR